MMLRVRSAGQSDASMLSGSSDLARQDDASWRVTGRRPAFELDAAMLRGRWLLIRAGLVASDGITPVGALARITVPGGAPTIGSAFVMSVGRPAGWIGYVPADAEAVSLEILSAADTIRLDSLDVRTVSRTELVARACLVNPLDAARAGFWRLGGRRMRARGRMGTAVKAQLGRSMKGMLSTEPTFSDLYSRWCDANDAITEAELSGVLSQIEASPDAPLISILMPVYDPVPVELEEAIASVRAQLYGRWELCIADDASTDPAVAAVLARAASADPRIKVVRRPVNGHISAASNSALELCTGIFTALMDHDDVIPPHALLFVVRELAEHPQTDLVYSDEDKIDERGRRYMPHFKSDWNEELFLTQNYVNHLGIYRTEILRRIGGFRVGLEGSQDHDLVLRFLDHTDETRIRHIPRVLYHWRNHRGTGSFSERSMAKAVAARRRALVDHVARRGWDAEVVEGAIGTNRLVRRLPDPAPEVAVIIPTRDRAGLLAVAARGVLQETDYPQLRLVLVDNGSVEPETEALFAELRRDPRVTIHASPGPFNYSKLNNEAVSLVGSELLLLLNNDIEVIEPNWLREMVGSLVPGVAAVGARLLYPDRTLQHGGVILGGGGVAGHAFLDISEEDPGYFGRAVLPQYLSAVTGACLLVRREDYLAVGGLDEAGLTVAFNDIDFCLKLRRRGRKIVYNPYAVLIHHESVSRGTDLSPEKRARFEREISTMLERWGPVLKRDPYYNPNLELDFADYRLRGHLRPGPPRYGKPRRKGVVKP